MNRVFKRFIQDINNHGFQYRAAAAGAAVALFCAGTYMESFGFAEHSMEQGTEKLSVLARGFRAEDSLTEDGYPAVPSEDEQDWLYEIPGRASADDAANDLSGELSGNISAYEAEYSCTELADGTVSIGLDYFSSTGENVDLEIPKEIEGRQVSRLDPGFMEGMNNVRSVTLPAGLIRIGEGAFRGCLNLESVRLPSTLEEIGDEAFSECTALASVSLPSGLKSIGSRAFRKCESLDRISVGPKVEKIGEGAFSYCSGCEVGVSDSNKSFSVRGGVLFDDQEQKLLWYPPNSRRTNYIVPEGTQRIGEGAFAGSGLSACILPKSLSSIGDEAFRECEKLTSPGLPEGLKRIGSHAFSGCASLTEILLPASLTEMGTGAFAQSSVIKYEAAQGQGTFQVIDGVLYSQDKKVLWSVPAGMERTFFRLEEETRTIAEEAFAGCGIHYVLLPDNLRIIGERAFENCGELRRADIPAGVVMMGQEIYKGCGSLRSVCFPDNLDIIGEGMLDGCSALTKVTLGTNTCYISDRAFRDCTSLRYLKLSEGITGIGSQAFAGCTALKKIYLPAGIKHIEVDAFSGFSGTMSVLTGSDAARWAIRQGYDIEQRPWSETETVGETDTDTFSDARLIAAVQEALTRSGFDPGAADGIAGNRTKEAIRAYRAGYGLSEDEEGRIDRELLKSLDITWNPETGEIGTGTLTNPESMQQFSPQAFRERTKSRGQGGGQAFLSER